MGSLLQGAGELPEPHVQIKDASEFAALWNSKTLEERQKLLDLLLEQQEAARQCWLRDHDVLEEKVKAQAAKLEAVATYADDRKRHARAKNNTVSSFRVASDLYQILGYDWEARG